MKLIHLKLKNIKRKSIERKSEAVIDLFDGLSFIDYLYVIVQLKGAKK